MNQPVIPDVALVDNTEQRTPLVLVLDCSGSMAGAAIDQLNEGMRLLEQELKDDAIACKRVRLLVVKFGGHDMAELVGDWQDAMDFTPSVLEATGTTPTGQAVDLALMKIEEEKAAFRQAGVAYTRPRLANWPSDSTEASITPCGAPCPPTKIGNTATLLACSAWRQRSAAPT